MSRAKFLALCLIVLATSVLAILMASRGTGSSADSAQPATAKHDDVTILGSGDLRWVEEAGREPTRIEFSKTMDGKPFAEAETKGRLDAQAKANLRRYATTNMGCQYATWEQKCKEPGSNPDGTKSLRDAIGEMEQLFLAKRAEAEVELINKDEYLTFDTKGKPVNKATIPGGYAPMITYNGGIIDGKAVDVLVLVPDDHPLVKPLMDEIKSMRDAAREQDITDFNASPEEQRKARIEQHEKALSEIRDLNAMPNYQGPAKQQRLRELYKQLLPFRWHYVGTLAYQTPESGK